MPAKKKPAAKKKAAKKKTTAKKKTVAKKTTAKKKTAAKKTTAKKKTVAKKTTAKKKTAAKKTTAKKVPAAKKTAAKKKTAVARKSSSSQEFKSYTPYKLTKGEEYMNEAQETHFRDILGRWKQELMEEVDRTVHHMQDEAANFPDPNDRATQESEFAMELRTRDRERKLIKKIEESLSGIDSGDYGYCEQCGVEIGIRRLEARPTANLCIDCKSLDEIREKTRA
jgi:DnaK suppressor protein